MSMNLTDIIKKVLRTEKSEVLRSKNNELLFHVDRRANKIQIKNAVEKLLDVKVSEVRTMTKKSIQKTRGGKRYFTPIIKKAIVRVNGPMGGEQ